MSKKDDPEKCFDLGEQARSIAEQFAGLDGVFTPMRDQVNEVIIPGMARNAELFHPVNLEEFEPDDSPWRTAAATEQMAEHTAALIGLTQAALDLAESSKASSDKVERFTRRMTWASLAIALASLAVAIVALAR